MEDLSAIYRKAEDYGNKLEEQKIEYIQKLRAILWGKAGNVAATTVLIEQPNTSSPQQVKKRAKRLTSLQEDEDEENKPPLGIEAQSPRKSTRASNSKLLAAAEALKEEEIAVKVNVLPLPVDKIIITSAETLMPPPPVPAPAAVNDETSFARPQRAAKLKSEKNLKEPKLNAKLRRPSNLDNAEIKLEQEHRQSQMMEAPALSHSRSQSSIVSTRSEESVVVVPGKNPSLVVINSDEEQTGDKMKDTQKSKESLEKQDLRNMRSCRVNIKREKPSIGLEEQQPTSDLENTPAITVEPLTVPMPKIPIKTENPSDDSALASTILSASTTSTLPATKKGRKKNNAKHKPIKVERFSDIVTPSPIASRTRKGSVGRSSSLQRAQQQEQPARAGSVYEDAVDDLPVNAQTVEAIETPPTRLSKVLIAAVNETVTLSSDNQNPNATTVLSATTTGDATFCTNPAQTTFQVAAAGQTTFVVDNQNPNATVTLMTKSQSDVDATFNVSQKNGPRSMSSTKHSMETAKDTSQPQDDSLITEDDSFERPKAAVASNMPAPKVPIMSKVPTSAKAYKMPTRTNELFNPLVQSPVKMKVKAFENAASSELSKSGRPKRTKETGMRTPSQPSMVLPAVGKLTAPALGRFLTPTQASTVTPNATQAKKGPNSASKALPFPKAVVSSTSASSQSSSSSSSNLKTTNSTSSKTLTRENSTDDFRRGLHQMAEERKKQREQKHLLAAQQREAKERERTERVAKLAKEREEKRLKKQLEAEQKKRELDEIQRKLRLQEEAAHAAEMAKQKAAKTKAIVDQERELLQLMKQQQQKAGSSKKRVMPPPPSKAKYNFEMLHEDDPTDDESTPSDTRPPPPSWSRSHVCAPIKLAQSFAPTDIIDCFFSVQPMTPDLKEIFPDIDARYLKRNSSVLWSTPPRYSELPKY